MRKENEIGSTASKLDDEQSLVSKTQKSIKEMQGRVEELEEELEAERQARAKAERQRSDLARDLESYGDRLNEAAGTTQAQVELNKKREAELGKMRKDIEEVSNVYSIVEHIIDLDVQAKIQQETTTVALKKKQQDAVGEMSEQIDQLSKIKAK